MFNCAHIKRSTFSRCKFFKTVLAEQAFHSLFSELHSSCFVDFILCPTDKYMFKVNNKKLD